MPTAAPPRHPSILLAKGILKALFTEKPTETSEVVVTADGDVEINPVHYEDHGEVVGVGHPAQHDE